MASGKEGGGGIGITVPGKLSHVFGVFSYLFICLFFLILREKIYFSFHLFVCVCMHAYKPNVCGYI